MDIAECDVGTVGQDGGGGRGGGVDEGGRESGGGLTKRFNLFLITLDNIVSYLKQCSLIF